MALIFQNKISSSSMIGWLAGIHFLQETRSYHLTSQELNKQVKFLEQIYISFILLLHWPPGSHHSNDVRAYLWRRLIYRDAHRTALCFQKVLCSYSNLPWAQSIPRRERDEGRTTKSKLQRTERVRASTSSSATRWTTVSRSKYKIY